MELAKVFDLSLDEFIDNYSTGMKKKLLIISQLKQDKKIFILRESHVHTRWVLKRFRSLKELVLH